ncbi:hypothetical protein MLD38_005836 [Melastoma candidum]|uniref:Uncharacterized protein n=1 Tax=Melastoma candidum TaxID=119954 RepID=A0ACB9RMX6_9MYRT|nr:hypothetical protein MLD38_005836 [Melastoma candidum]
MDNSVSSSFPSSRNSSYATQNDVANFFQCLPSYSKSLALDIKFSRPGDMKRSVGVALGLSSNDALSNTSKAKMLGSLSLEELKRVKLGLCESGIKARERVKFFSEALTLLTKIFPSISTKKRSRSEVFERSSSILSNDRPAQGSGPLKTGNHCSILAGNFEHGLQKSEEQTKSLFPSKRTRTSMLDGKLEARANSFVRPSRPVDCEKESPKLPSGGVSQCEDQTLSSVGVEGWEKSKMKKKRSGIKADVSSVSDALKRIDGYRELNQGMQQRSIRDVRIKPNNELNEVRPGVMNGALENGKTEGFVQQTGSSTRFSIPEAELDISSFSIDKKDRPVSSDKERDNNKAVVKPNCREDLASASLTSSYRINPSIRGPRSSIGNGTKLSPSISRASVSNEASLATGAPNRKRSTSVRPPSPVTCWPRPQKISRSARRRNFVPTAMGNEESSPIGSTSDVIGEAGMGFPRRMHRSSPQHPKLKSEPLSSSMLSEGEDTEFSDIKPRERLKKADEMDEKFEETVHKVSPVIVSSRKNKYVSGKVLGDGIRRQGRSGRIFKTSRTSLPVSDVKVGNDEAKHLRNARNGFDSKENKPGRPISQKLSDRKVFNRQRHASVNVTSDFIVGPNDGNEELLAAANAVVTPSHSVPSKMLEQVEAAFGFIYDEDISFLKEQVNHESSTQTPNLTATELDNCSGYLDIFGLTGREKNNERDVHQWQKIGTHDQEAVPLWQRLIAALIPEEEAEYCDTEHSVFMTDGQGSSFELDQPVDPNVPFYDSGTIHRHSDSFSSEDCLMSNIPDQQGHENDVIGLRELRIISDSDHPINGLLKNPELIPPRCSEAQYDNMSIDERVLLEMHSISIFPEAVPKVNLCEDDGIADDIQKLMKKHHSLVSQKNEFLEKLLKGSLEVKESQERGFEQHAMDKLVVVTYQKYMTCWGPSNAKSAGNKMAKQAALSLVKRTVQRCKKYEATGKSCFAEPPYKNIFLNSTSRQSVVPLVEAILEASENSQHSPSLSQKGLRSDNHDVDSSDMLRSATHMCEQTSSKEEMWSNRVKQRELSLQEVGGVPSGIQNPLLSSAKGKRSERDRDGKGQGREMLSGPGYNKNGRSTLFNSKGERKSKAKPKQKMTQLSASINGLLGCTAEQAKSALPTGSKLNPVPTSSNPKSFVMNTLDDMEAIDLSSMQLGDVDELGVSHDLGGQGHDLDSWLNIEDDNLQDHDFMGLEIPMDDLSDVKLML